MSKAKSNKTKKTVTTPVKSKSTPKKNKPEVSGIPPEKQSAPMKAALEAVAAMPVTKESKLAAVIGLLKRPEGATIEDVVAVTGWQKHTVRACISHALAKKRGYQIVSDKPQGGKRIYKIAEPAPTNH